MPSLNKRIVSHVGALSSPARRTWRRSGTAFVAAALVVATGCATAAPAVAQSPTVAQSPAAEQGAAPGLQPAEPGKGDPASVQAADAAAKMGDDGGYAITGPFQDWIPTLDPERDPNRYLPSPPADPWYAAPPAIDPATPNGTILASRPVTIPIYHMRGVAEAWQVLLKSTDTYGAPQPIIATIVLPTAAWNGPGARPLVASNYAIDSLGLNCSPSYTLLYDFNPQINPFNPSFDQRALDAGMALVIPDHEGPKGAYAAGRQAGHAVLDSMRAARAFVPPGHTEAPLAQSLIGQIGFSGGAIAAGWAAQIQKDYAPDLDNVLVGTSIGGVPADFSVLMTSMDGFYGSAGLFRAAVLGVAREYPELYRLLNPAGDLFAYASRNSCADELTAQGLIPMPIAALTVQRQAFSDPEVRRVLAENRLGVHPDRPTEVPGHPVQIWQGDASVPLVPGIPFGINDYWVPTWAVQRLAQEWRDAGVPVTYTPVAGEHLISGNTGIPPAFHWLDTQFRTTAAPAGE